MTNQIINKAIKECGLTKVLINELLNKNLGEDSEELNSLFILRKELAVKGIKIKEIETFVNKLPKCATNPKKTMTGVIGVQVSNFKKRHGEE